MEAATINIVGADERVLANPLVARIAEVAGRCLLRDDWDADLRAEVVDEMMVLLGIAINLANTFEQCDCDSCAG